MSIKVLKSALATSGEHLGDLVWWSLSDVSIERADLETRWKTALLSASLLPEPPSPEKALKAAVRECSAGHPDRLIRLGHEDETQLIYGIVKETRSPAGLAYAQEAMVTLTKQSATVIADNPQHDIAQPLCLAFSRLRTVHSADDVRRSLVKTLTSFSSVTLREGGGVYFVPRTSAEPLRRLQTFVESLGHSHFHLVPIHKSGESTKTLGEVARSSLETDLAELQAEIAIFKKEPPARDSTLVHRLEAFQEIKSRAELYRSILEVNVADIDVGLNDLAASVEAMLLTSRAA